MNWNQPLSRLYKYLVSFGITIIAIYIIFQLIALSYPFFSNRFIFQLFDVGHEANIPTYFSVLLLFCLAMLVWAISIFEKNKKPWIASMLLFLFLGLDELASIHEQLTYHVQSLLGVGGFFEFAWTIPYLILSIILAIYFIPWLWKLKYGKWLLLGAFIFILGAVGLEMLSAYYYGLFGTSHIGFIVASSIEEILEITGLLVALFAFKQEILLKIDGSKA